MENIKFLKIQTGRTSMYWNSKSGKRAVTRSGGITLPSGFLLFSSSSPPLVDTVNASAWV